MQEMMGATDIAFPHLGIYLENVPKGFTVFGFFIALYGIFIAIGILCGILLAAHIAKISGDNPDIIWDFSIYAVISSIVGARLYYVAFDWDTYKDDLLQIFNTRNGGLAVYGGVIAAVLALVIYSKIKKINFYSFVDYCMAPLALGQAIGRLGNFTNREVFGQYSDGLLAMRLPLEAVRSRDVSVGIAAHIIEGTNYIQVHPTFLYEGLWNLALMTIILCYRKHKKFEGELFLIYLGGYGLGRAWIEGIRTDQLFIPGTTIAVSQVLAIVFVVVAIISEIVNRIRIKSNESIS